MMEPIEVSLLAAMMATFSRSFLPLTGMRHLLELLDDVLDRLLDAAFHHDRIDAGDDGAQAFIEDRLGHDGGGGGAIAGHVVGLGSDFLDHLGAHVLVVIFELDLAGDGDAVLGDGGGAEALLQDDIAALGAKRHLDGAGQLADAAAHRFTGFLIERNLLCSHFEILRMGSELFVYSAKLTSISGSRG